MEKFKKIFIYGFISRFKAHYFQIGLGFFLSFIVGYTLVATYYSSLTELFPEGYGRPAQGLLLVIVYYLVLISRPDPSKYTSSEIKKINVRASKDWMLVSLNATIVFISLIPIFVSLIVTTTVFFIVGQAVYPSEHYFTQTVTFFAENIIYLIPFNLLMLIPSWLATYYISRLKGAKYFLRIFIIFTALLASAIIYSLYF